MNTKFFVTALILVTICSCSSKTGQIWKNRDYDENISHLLATENGKETIFIGEKYHYIFKNQSSMNKLINWEHNNILEIQFENSFNVNSEDRITGTYKAICNCINEENIKLNWLKNNGFIEDRSIDGRYYKDDSISGKRYWSNDMKLSKSKKMDKDFKIKVVRKYTTGETLLKTAISPVTLTLDTAEYVFYGSALIVLGPFIAISTYFSDADKK